jgi:hypothetical protein
VFVKEVGIQGFSGGVRCDDSKAGKSDVDDECMVLWDMLLLRFRENPCVIFEKEDDSLLMDLRRRS